MKTFNDLRKELAKEDIQLYTAMEIVGKIMATRERLEISQRKLSELSGVPQKTISRIENGIDIPKLSTLLKLTNALGLELSVTEKKEIREEEHPASLS